MYRFIILLVLLWAGSAEALTIREASDAVADSVGSGFRWAQDTPKFTDDKAAHLGLGFMAATFTAWAWDADSEPAQWGNLFWNAAFWTAWEIKDGFMPWEKYGAAGGDGFSWYDLAYSVAGGAAAMLIWK